MLQVKQIHITKAKYGVDACPIWMALHELHPSSNIQVTYGGILVDYKLLYRITDRMSVFMNAYDGWGASFVKPTAFRLLKVRN